MRSRVFAAPLLVLALVGLGRAGEETYTSDPLAVKVAEAAPAEPEAPSVAGPKDNVDTYLIELKVKAVPKGTLVTWDVFVKDSRTNLYYDAVGLARVRQIKADHAIAVAGPAGEYRVRCRLVKGEDYSDLVWEGKLTGGVAPLPPGPPVPDPSLPAGALGLIKVSREGLAKTTAGRDKAGTLAVAQRGHASAVAAGAFGNDAEKILAEWRVVNKATVDGAQWGDWGKAVSAKLAELHAAGKLPSSAEWSAAFEEIAKGLEGK